MFGDPAIPPRIWSRLRVLESGCWEWFGAKSRGYGYASFGGRNQVVHRAIWLVLGMPNPGELDLDHLCRNRACCNPVHLEIVTRSENCLRGVGPALVMKRAKEKAECRRGHAFTAENIGHNKRGSRFCRACKALATQRFRKKHPHYARDWWRENTKDKSP